MPLEKWNQRYSNRLFVSLIKFWAKIPWKCSIVKKFQIVIVKVEPGTEYKVLSVVVVVQKCAKSKEVSLNVQLLSTVQLLVQREAKEKQLEEEINWIHWKQITLAHSLPQSCYFSFPNAASKRYQTTFSRFEVRTK